MLAPNTHAWLVGAVALLAACGGSDSKSSGGGEADPGILAQTGTATSTAIQPGGNSGGGGSVTPIEPISGDDDAEGDAAQDDDKTDTAKTPEPLSSPGNATLSNLPGNPSNATALAVTVADDDLNGYRYALVDGSTCSGVSYSKVAKAGVAITDAIGADGVKTLCVLTEAGGDKGVFEVTALSHSWLKDTVPPTASLTAPTGFGPGFVSGATFPIAYTAADAASGLASTSISVRKGAGATSCLNAGKTAFNASCPQWLAATGGSLAFADSIFSDGSSYAFSISASDLAGNTNTVNNAISLTWDATVPSNVTSLTATAGQQQVALSWSSATGATTYVVLRRADQAVGESLAAGAPPSVGAHLGDGNFVACVTSSTSCTDTDLEAFATYHYKVFALDAARNATSGGATAQAQPSAIPAFQGLSYAYLWGPGRRIASEWQMFTPTGKSSADVDYQVFAADSSGGQDFQDTPAATVAASAADRAEFVDTGSGDSVYIVGREDVDGIGQDDNTRQLRVKLAPGTHHKIAAGGRLLGEVPLTQAFLRSTWAVKRDPFGNIAFGSATGMISVLCRETTSAYYCRGRTADRVYTIVGTDGADDGPDDALASATALGDIYGIDFDSAGNMYLADSTYFRVRVVCYDPTAVGFCNGKRQAYVYHIAGTGSSGDALDDSVAKTAQIGAPYDVAVDAWGNVYLADNTNRRIRVACQESSHGPCSGKVVGNLYYVAGTGTAADGADGQARLIASFGSPGAMALDANGNVFFTDATYPRVRAVCFQVAAGNGFCTGKTAGKVYRIAGTGASANGTDDVTADTAGIGTLANGIRVSAAGNVYVTDGTFFWIRALCYETTSDHWCQGRTVGNHYRIAGTGANTDGNTNGLSLNSAIGTPRGIAFDNSMNLVVADSGRNRLRLECASSSDLCATSLSDYHYHLVGTGSTSLGWQINSMRTPVGTPQGTAIDAAGNIFVADTANFVVRVICYDTTVGGFCYGKTAGSVYIVAGSGATGNAADGVLAVANPIAAVTGIDLDSEGNLYIADNTNRFIRVVCTSTAGAAGNYCYGKQKNYMYRFSGTGTAGDGADNTVATASNTGNPQDVALDNYDNVFITDQTYFRVRLICRSTSGACAGKTVGNMYRFAGTGVAGDGADNAVASSTAFGTPGALALDPQNNIWLGDTQYFRVRAICVTTTGPFCTGKTAGRTYRVAGTGATGDGADDATASTTTMGAPFGVAIDPTGNVFVLDSTYRRVRALCMDTSDGFCAGLTVGNVYRAFGNGAAVGDASSGYPGSQIRLDAASRDGIAITPSGDFVTVGTSGAVRMFIGY